MNGNEGVIVVARTRDEIEGARDGWKERYGRRGREDRGLILFSPFETHVLSKRYSTNL